MSCRHSTAVCALLAAAAHGATLEDGGAVSFWATIPERGTVSLSLGRGQERLAVSSKDDAYPWSYRGVDGSNPQERPYPGGSRPLETTPYWWERTDYTPNGRYRRSFAMPDAVEAESEAMQSERWQSAASRRLRFRVELADGMLAFYLDDILLHALAATGDVAGREVKVSASNGATVSAQSLSPVSSAPRFYRVPLGLVASKESSLAADVAEFGGVPFLPGVRAVDVGRSWVRENCIEENGAPNAGAFGGRWAGALSATPCRLQFRVPNRRYEAMYLLASCRERNFLTVQFYRPGSGFPVDCLPAEPIAADGSLQLVRVPIRQDMMAQFADRETLEFELTGRVDLYSAYPEPSYFSRHGGGEPSGVVVHGITLKEAAVEIDFTPERFGGVWTGLSPSPAYLLSVRNRTGSDMDVPVRLKSSSWDGADVTDSSRSVRIAAHSCAKVRLEVPVSKFGWHSVSLSAGGEPYERSLVVLRNRRHDSRPFDAKGIMFGSWPPGDRHFGPPVYDACRLLFPLGIEAFPFRHICKRADVESLAKKFGVKDFLVSDFNSGRSPWFEEPGLEERMLSNAVPSNAVSAPSYQCLFAEPGGIGPVATAAALCGEPVPEPTEEERARYLFYKTNIVHFSEIFRRNFPGRKLLMPWGSPLFAAAYLRDPDTRGCFDGIGFDTAFFDRLPEGQMHACSLYLLTLFNREWRKFRSGSPLVLSMEGPCLSRVAPEAMSAAEHMRNTMRANLMITANGATRLFSALPGSAEPVSYWGEQHYANGLFSRITLDPRPTYAAMGTMIRHMRDCEFVRAVPTGSHGVFVLEYANRRTGEPLHVAWCVHGRVPYRAKHKGSYDAMDNEDRSGMVSPSPVFIVGCRGGISFGRQVLDLADVTPAPDAVKVGNLAEWRQSAEPPDDEYLNSMPEHIRRHPIQMDVSASGGMLSVALPADAPDAGAMPHCTALVPPAPVALPGRPRVIALEVSAAADWGRVVYVLRDAKGEKFTSVGRPGTYNVDDPRCDSFFSFNGTRLVRMELPGNRPWDASRYRGSQLWGTSGGDGVVDYPLCVEKMFVERRRKVMYVNGLVDADASPVLLGALYAEGIEPDSPMRMPPPPPFRRVNPMRGLRGTLPPSEVTGVSEPAHYYDGTRGHFAFREMPGAASYDIYVSLNPEGDGAIRLGAKVPGSGALVKGFLPNVDNYAFVVWRNAKGEVSEPSAPFRFMLRNRFAER